MNIVVKKKGKLDTIILMLQSFRKQETWNYRN